MNILNYKILPIRIVGQVLLSPANCSPRSVAHKQLRSDGDQSVSEDELLQVSTQPLFESIILDETFFILVLR